ncbi:hypothetical protein [Wansuia hejianensis]|uniref:Transglycosylase n=1 Tax=Wansuia hejianensis TaxID=2763667 RepID=A0A926F251_9FIRM|nr:hypothetical protein [Wansuia hejianensis]MBC8590617.1 hypothetical protein [Wansuia hejianensis]
MKNTYCDKCKKGFIVEVKSEQLEGNIERVYFTCPHCGEDYTSYYTNVLVQIKQRKVRELAEKFEKERNPLKAEKIFKQYQKAKKTVGEEMEKLRKRIQASTN